LRWDSRIGKKLREAREHKGWTQTELGHYLTRHSGESRFSSSMISLLESGRRPIKVADIRLFAEVLEKPARFFFEGLEEMASQNDVRDVLLRAGRTLHPAARKGLLELVRRATRDLNVPDPSVHVTPRMSGAKVAEAAGYGRPPVDPRDVATKLGLKVVIDESLVDEISGFLVRECNLIGANAKHVPQRQRFSIAHEIGHYVKRHNTVVDMAFSGEWSNVNPFEERQANAFAAQLLMPEDWVRRDFMKLESSKADFVRSQELAWKYDVSEQAMWIRLLELGLVTEDSAVDSAPF